MELTGLVWQIERAIQYGNLAYARQRLMEIVTNQMLSGVSAYVPLSYNSHLLAISSRRHRTLHARQRGRGSEPDRQHLPVQRGREWLGGCRALCDSQSWEQESVGFIKEKGGKVVVHDKVGGGGGGDGGRKASETVEQADGRGRGVAVLQEMKADDVIVE
eukprot:765195-Hanusia_phi.AAC.2